MASDLIAQLTRQRKTEKEMGPYRKSWFNVLLIVVTTLWPATTAFCGTIYNNTVLSGAASGLTGSNRTIQIDDVLIPSSRNPSNLPIAINSITVGLLATPGDSGQFSIYLFPANSDGTPDPNFVLIDTLSVTFTSPFQLATFDRGSGPLFTVNANFAVQPGFGLFYVGLEASSIPAADWVWANGPDTNLPTAYLDNLTAGQIFLNTPPPSSLPFSFYLKIDGAPVPEASSIFLLGTGMLALGGILLRDRRVERLKGYPGSAGKPART